MFGISSFRIFCALILQLAAVFSENSSDLIVIILSQPNSYHAHKAGILKDGLLKQAEELKLPSFSVLLLHEWAADNVGAWTILPILHRLSEEFPEKSAFVFCEEHAIINLRSLVSKLDVHDFTKEIFLGRALRDKEATIIHHFAFHDKPRSFAYPDFAACFIISSPLVKSVVKRLKNSPPRSEFSIDAQHELALYLYDNGNGISLTEAGFLCGYTDTARGDCATYSETKLTSCGEAVSNDKVLLAVKTCEKYHKSRVSIVKKTWGKQATHIQYFSDVDDTSVPTITLGVPNTERGHCAKCMAMLRYIYERQNTTQYDWIVIVDDDTLISVSRLRKLLSCYYATDLVALGERYGYSVLRDGYNYITLGGGMALSRVMLQKLVSDADCKCGADDSPDDMTLGMCLKGLNISLTHSPLFHQGRPDDYSPEYLSNQLPVSFHRHWMVDALSVYNNWLADVDDEGEPWTSSSERTEGGSITSEQKQQNDDVEYTDNDISVSDDYNDFKDDDFNRRAEREEL